MKDPDEKVTLIQQARKHLNALEGSVNEEDLDLWLRSTSREVLARNLRFLRRPILDCSSHDLDKILGFARGTTGKIESFKLPVKVRPLQVILLASAFGVDPRVLFRDDLIDRVRLSIKSFLADLAKEMEK